MACFAFKLVRRCEDDAVGIPVKRRVGTQRRRLSACVTATILGFGCFVFMSISRGTDVGEGQAYGSPGVHEKMGKRLSSGATFVALGLACVAFAPTSYGAGDSASLTYPSPEAALKAIYGSHLINKWEVRGDLDGDGQPDWAGVVAYEEADANRRRLIILTRTKDGGYTVAAQSKPDVQWDSAVEELEISVKDLFANFSHGGGDHPFKWVSQVRLYKNQWRIIGTKITSYDVDDTKSIVEDTNTLTGNKITSYMDGKRTLRVERSKVSDTTNLLEDTTP